MKYVGIHTQQVRNNINSILLLILFPVILLAMVWLFLTLVNYGCNPYYDDYGNPHYDVYWQDVIDQFLLALPWVVGIVLVWFLIAYFSNTAMIRRATGAKPLTRKENMRVYNIVENLTMACGMPMPQINIIDDPQLNAFASGIDEKTYTVTLTTGIIDLLDDEELKGVVGHELTHIRNKDTRLLIISIIFVGIMSTIMTVATRVMMNMVRFGGLNSRRSSRDSKGGGAAIIFVILIAIICAAIGYLFTLLTRFAISRKREFLADAGGAELCGNPLALASALRKISGDPALGGINREDIAQLFIINPKMAAHGFSKFMSGLFSTHPSTEERIRILEQF